MTTSTQIGRVKLAIGRLASDFPYHAAVLARWKLVEDNRVQTMGIGLKDGQLMLYFRPEFVERLSMDQLMAVLHHESNHVLFRHVLHDPDTDENKRARVVAQEVTANEWVPGPLPGTPILLSQYPYLPANEDTDSRYDILRSRIKDDKTAKDKNKPTDDHSTWRELQESPDLAKSVVNSCLVEAWDSLTEAQTSKVDGIFVGISTQAGTDVGRDESMLDAGTAKVPWSVLLRRYVGRELVRRPVFGRPPRRFPHLVGIVPGKGRSTSKARVMAVIDTSGSMTEEMLSDISSELARMARTHVVTVVECDTQVHDVYSYRPITSVAGRGGTDFRPPLEQEFLRKHKPDLIIYFTDGYGPAPDKQPRIPVIWCLTEGGRMPAEWGREIRM